MTLFVPSLGFNEDLPRYFDLHVAEKPPKPRFKHKQDRPPRATFATSKKTKSYSDSRSPASSKSKGKRRSRKRRNLKFLALKPETKKIKRASSLSEFT